MSTDALLRRATKVDIPTIIMLQKNDGFPHQYYLTHERLERLFGRGELFFLATLDGVTVGFASIDCEIRAKAHFLSVDQRYAHKGVGSMLMKALMDEAKSRGYDRLSVYVEAGSIIKVFLIKHGFVQVGYYKNRYGNGKDATIWEVDLLHRRNK